MESHPSAAGEEPLLLLMSSPREADLDRDSADDASKPSGDENPVPGADDAAQGGKTDGAPPARRRPMILLPENATLDEIIASIPEEVVARLSSTEIEALASGDPQAVARVMNLPELAPGAQRNLPSASRAAHPGPSEFTSTSTSSSPSSETDLSANPYASTNPNPNTAPARADLESDEDGPTRISLRALPPRERRAVADAIQAVKEGRYRTFDEARASLNPAQRPGGGEPQAAGSRGRDGLAEGEGRASGTESQATMETGVEHDTQPETSPEIAGIQQRIEGIEAQQEEAAHGFDTPRLLQLNRELIDAKLELRDALADFRASQLSSQQWSQQEARHIADARERFAVELANPEFAAAFADVRDLAEHRRDPALESPDWPLVLLRRAAAGFKAGAGAGGQGGAHANAHAHSYAQPQTPFPRPPAAEPRVRGELSSPALAGLPAMSLEEAMRALDEMPEDQVDAVIAGIKARERRAMLYR